MMIHIRSKYEHVNTYLFLKFFSVAHQQELDLLRTSLKVPIETQVTMVINTFKQ